jgi:hypothetical protein
MAAYAAVTNPSTAVGEVSAVDDNTPVGVYSNCFLQEPNINMAEVNMPDIYEYFIDADFDRLLE